MLEVLVHLDKSELPDDFAVMTIRFDGHAVGRPGMVAQHSMPQLDPKMFRETFYKSSVLRLPSIIVPREYNYVLLPEARAAGVTICWIEPLSFDVRLFSGAPSRY